MSTALVWLRRDLRVHDHPALRAALDGADTVVPVFVLDDRLLGGRHASGSRVQFMLDCLKDLRQSMQDRGGDLVVLHGRPEREVPRLAREVGAGAVHFSYDVGDFARRRDGKVKAELDRHSIAFHAHPGVFAMENPAAIQTGGGRPYTVFTPFSRAWAARNHRALAAAPRSLPALPSRLTTGRIPSLEALGLQQEIAEPASGGESAAREAVNRWLSGPVDAYDDSRNDVANVHGISRLSPYLRFGCISARELEDRLGTTTGQAAFKRQLAWRDFYGYILHHFPGNGRREYQERYRDGRLEWVADEEGFSAWCEGRTGYPLVDAGMRQLLREGWMHNRVRMVVGSFLTKDLGIDWRRGEAHFMRYLLDGDPASNNGNWQWIASTGVDPAPVFRRILSPTRQQERFDPDGVYVREYVPELRDVPDRYLAEPWRMTDDEQSGCGVRVGTDYPAPIVDHAQAREEALARYRQAGAD